MRKIEREMQRALCDRRNWRKDNTEVAINDAGDSFVYLHGHNIATIANNGDIRLSSCVKLKEKCSPLSATYQMVSLGVSPTPV